MHVANKHYTARAPKENRQDTRKVYQEERDNQVQQGSVKEKRPATTETKTKAKKVVATDNGPNGGRGAKKKGNPFPIVYERADYCKCPKGTLYDSV